MNNMPTGTYAERKLEEDRNSAIPWLIFFKSIIKLPNGRSQERHLLSWEGGVKCRHKMPE